MSDIAIDLDVVTRLNRATAREAAREAQQYFKDAGPDAGDGFMDGLSKSITSKSPEVEQALKKVADASGKVIVEQEKLNALKEKSTTTDAKLIAQSERLRKAHADESAAIRDVNNVLREAENALGAVTGAADGAGKSLESVGQQFAAIGRIGGPALIVGAVSALGQLTGIAAQATGVLGLLPGVIGAAGLAFGTLKIATLGVSDAMGALKDPEKFAAALAALSPNAQQATLAIKGLLPAFDELQQKSQNALFAGVGGELNALANQYLPQIEATTTGIASAFNSMFAGVTQQLLTPDTQASIQQFMANVTQAFQNLSSATAPLASAFADIMNVGSSFLPQIAAGATDAAKAFGDLVHEAMQSGQMRQWMQEGLNVIQQLWPVVKNLASTFMQLGDQTKDSLPQIVNALNGIVDVLPGIVNAATALTAPLTSTLSLIGQIGEATKGMGSVSTTIWSSLTNTLFDVLQPLKAIYDIYKLITDPGGFAKDIGAGGTAQADAAAKLDAARAAHGLPPMASGTGGIPGVPIGGYTLPAGAGAGIGNAAFGASYAPSRWSAAASNPFASSSSGGGGGASKTPFIDPSKYLMGDPLAGMPGAVAGSDPTAIYAADSKLITATHNLEQGKLAVQVLQAKGNATQQELLTAKNNLVEQERAVYDAQADDIKARTNQMKQSASDLASVFAPLAQDFGISKGLPGIVENLTRMFGNMALAGAIGSSPTLQTAALSLMSDQSGSGQTTGASALAQYGIPGVSQLGPAALRPGGSGAYPGDQALLANVPAGKYGREFGSDLTKGLGDCSSAVADLVNLMDGKTTAESNPMYTGNEADFLTSRGFLPGMGGPGDMRVGFDAAHTQATLPGGTNFSWGSKEAAASGGLAPNSGAAYGDQHYYRPAGGNYGGAGAPVATGGGGGGIPIPDITNPGLYDPSTGTYGGPPNPFTMPPGAGPLGALGGPNLHVQGAIGSGANHYDANRPTGGGNFNPNMQIDTSTTSVAPPYDPNRIGMHDIENMRNGAPNGLPEDLFGGVGFLGGGAPLGPNIGPVPLGGGVGGMAGAFGGSPFGPGGALSGIPGGIAPGQVGPPGGGIGGAPGQIGPFPVPSGIGPRPPGGVGAGAGLGGPTGAPAGFSTGIAPQGGGGPGLQLGGAGFDGAMMAAGALDLMAPGAGQAAQIGIKLGKRAIEYGGQVAGIAASGVAETFLPSGSPLGNFGNSWFGKIAGGVAGARPAKDNMAGKAGATPPQQGQPGQGGGVDGQPAQPVWTGDYHNHQATEDRAGADLTNHLSTMNSSPGPGNPRG